MDRPNFPSRRVVLYTAILAITTACLAFPRCQTSKPVGAPANLDDLYQFRRSTSHS